MKWWIHRYGHLVIGGCANSISITGVEFCTLDYVVCASGLTVNHVCCTWGSNTCVEASRAPSGRAGASKLISETGLRATFCSCTPTWCT